MADDLEIPKPKPEWVELSKEELKETKKPNLLARLFRRKKKEKVEVLKDIPKLREVITNPDGKLVEVSSKVKKVEYDRQKKEGVYHF